MAAKKPTPTAKPKVLAPSKNLFGATISKPKATKKATPTPTPKPKAKTTPKVITPRKRLDPSKMTPAEKKAYYDQPGYDNY